MIQRLRVLLSFTGGSDHQVEETAGAVVDGITGKRRIPHSAGHYGVLKAGLTAFTNAIAGQAQAARRPPRSRTSSATN